ncbi:DUF2255 family protein [Antarcticibacterium arcticum]|uniref:DUF2255 family protein n=1 Tax=Antarcticibacterium arcticum TaxID=2585771 RepID=A0A5B8YJ14_9FLAO|nr:DUF2255 family protein [Antarcticibacterium arcticum]QED37932.1 DUF2255 family protein [Antarcticibacterium arcticum]
MFEKDLYDYLNTHTRIEIKGGLDRPTFLPIWMVNVNGRLFSRSWNKSDRSWFTEFLKSGKGQIKYGEKIVNVSGHKIDSEDEINKKIDASYLQKYTQPENIPYAQGITQPEYANYTMEFKLEEK